MKIVLINPQHSAIGSRIPGEHLPPLGLLNIGGPLIDAGFEVRLIDADLKGAGVREIVADLRFDLPGILMIGHSGSSSANDTVLEICREIKKEFAGITIVYGGVHPTYHYEEVLHACPEIDFIVRGEGELTALRLTKALTGRTAPGKIAGLAFRNGDKIISTPAASVIDDLDAFRTGWELINHQDYSYWGGKRAVVVQFSRGCPYPCSYCGQRGFWTRWRHRDPVKFARELARLYREHGVELINFADELPTGRRDSWKAFLEALIAENVPLILVGSTRAGDIVRDSDILHLYKQAGVIRFLLGIESYDEATIAEIRKGANSSDDRQAIELLRAHGIISMATYVVGFGEESDRDYWRSLRHLISYDPDQIQLLYATPHKWTPFYRSVEHRQVIQTDFRRWDYKHQVLAARKVPAWRVFCWFKLIEALVQLRPRVLLRMLFHTDEGYRHAMRWYTRIGRRVWFHEIFEFIFKTRTLKHGPTLAEYSGRSCEDQEYAMLTGKNAFHAFDGNGSDDQT